MSKKHTNTCNDCIHYDICYKIEHFGRDLETNIPCKEFIGVTDRVEVVRCKNCVLHGHCSTEDVFLFSRLKSENAFCCVGKKKENDDD